ncbi:hypothetical protein [Salipiger mucosus]|uniref:hypothetical protein n=1 Tax=Salipiger mucosus TaxID=263378 RepID=UPI00036A4061|nr:hypothetical protein [Salipiger mucosus]
MTPEEVEREHAALDWVEAHQEGIWDDLLHRLQSRLFPISPDVLDLFVGGYLDQALSTVHIEKKTDDLGFNVSSYPKETDNP